MGVLFPSKLDKSNAHNIIDLLHNFTTTATLFVSMPVSSEKMLPADQSIVEALAAQIKRGPNSLVGDKGFRKYLKIEKGSTSIDQSKVENEARFDGKRVLTTNTYPSVAKAKASAEKFLKQLG